MYIAGLMCVRRPVERRGETDERTERVPRHPFAALVLADRGLRERVGGVRVVHRPDLAQREHAPSNRDGKPREHERRGEEIERVMAQPAGHAPITGRRADASGPRSRP